MSNVVKHPAAALMDEVNAERAVAETPEAYELREAIDKAIYAYWKYLDRHGMFYDHGRELVRATALHVICDMCGTIDIMIKMVRSTDATAMARIRTPLEQASIPHGRRRRLLRRSHSSGGDEAASLSSKV